MQSTKTNAGLAAGDFLPGVVLGGLIGLLVGLKAGLLIGLVVGIPAGALITFFVYSQNTARPDRRGGGDGGSTGGGDADWAHAASQRCFDSAHSIGSGDGGGDGGDCGGDGGGGGD